MTKILSALALACAVTVSAKLAVAEPQYILSPARQQAYLPGELSRATETSSVEAYRANINPDLVVPTTGIYDQGDPFTDARGFPLGGWSQINFTFEE